MELKDYSTEELKAELKRRAEEIRKHRDDIPRCRLCKHFGTITPYGEPTERKTFPYYTCCPYNKVKSGKWYKNNPPSQLACEHFDRK